MRILIIGGTHFVGHGMAQAALDAGHDVTLLHRNQTDELAGATHLLADRNGDLSLLDGLSWDATIDVCAYLPGQVRHLHEALGDRGGHHVFVSTVSVYAEPATAGADEDSPLFDEAAADVEEITNETYGPLKVVLRDRRTRAVRRRRPGDRPTDVRRGAAGRHRALPLLGAPRRARRPDPGARPRGGSDAVRRRPRHGCVDGASGRGPRLRGVHRGPTLDDVRGDGGGDGRRAGQRRRPGPRGRRLAGRAGRRRRPAAAVVRGEPRARAGDGYVARRGHRADPPAVRRDRARHPGVGRGPPRPGDQRPRPGSRRSASRSCWSRGPRPRHDRAGRPPPRRHPADDLHHHVRARDPHRCGQPRPGLPGRRRSGVRARGRPRRDRVGCQPVRTGWRRRRPPPGDRPAPAAPLRPRRSTRTRRCW